MACWEQAARYGLSAELLYAVARVESDRNPRAVYRSHLQRTGSYDIGLMQIRRGLSKRRSTCNTTGSTSSSFEQLGQTLNRLDQITKSVADRTGLTQSQVAQFAFGAAAHVGISPESASTQYIWTTRLATSSPYVVAGISGPPFCEGWLTSHHSGTRASPHRSPSLWLTFEKGRCPFHLDPRAVAGVDPKQRALDLLRAKVCATTGAGRPRVTARSVAAGAC
jgi:Transglycosylase SLT domain